MMMTSILGIYIQVVQTHDIRPYSGDGYELKSYSANGPIKPILEIISFTVCQQAYHLNLPCA